MPGKPHLLGERRASSCCGGESHWGITEKPRADVQEGDFTTMEALLITGIAILVLGVSPCGDFIAT